MDQLAKNIRHGDEAAFATFFQQTYYLVIRYLRYSLLVLGI
jgi:hypothetical protein